MWGISKEEVLWYDFEVSYQELFFSKWGLEALILTVFALLYANIFCRIIMDLTELEELFSTKARMIRRMIMSLPFALLVCFVTMDFNFMNVCDDADGFGVLLTQGWGGVRKIPMLGKLLNLVIFAGLYSIARKYLREHLLKDLQDSGVFEK